MLQVQFTLSCMQHDNTNGNVIQVQLTSTQTRHNVLVLSQYEQNVVTALQLSASTSSTILGQSTFACGLPRKSYTPIIFHIFTVLVYPSSVYPSSMGFMPLKPILINIAQTLSLYMATNSLKSLSIENIPKSHHYDGDFQMCLVIILQQSICLFLSVFY